VNVLAFLMSALQAPQQNSVDLVAIAGIVGTLLGTALGSFVTWKIQARQLAHADRTRFHERRLAVYAEFTNAANQIVASIKVGSVVDVSAMRKQIESYDLLRLVATGTVKNAADAVYNAVLQVQRAGNPTPDTVFQQFNTQVYNFITKAREEIGVDKMG
jgi:phage-related tail fiber protein